MSEPEELDGQQPVEEAASQPPKVDAPIEPSASAAQAAAGESVAAVSAVAVGDAPGTATAVEEPAKPRRRHPFYLRGRRLRLPSSRKGLFALLLVVVALGSVAAFSMVTLIAWTETADFCGRCHTMAPELMAYKAGPHRDVNCAECHVEPGITGWVKAKINGTRQLIDVVLGTFPQPIEPPDHSLLPSTADTCKKCHALDQRQFVALRTQTQFAEDETNTRQFVGLMIRPGGGNTFDVTRSVHWHVFRDVKFTSSEVNGATIDYVQAFQPDGSSQEWIAQSKIVDATNVTPDVEAVKASQTMTTMTCYDCHNRVGHNLTNPRAAIDFDMYVGNVDPSLPYIKRESMRILWSSYPDTAAANAEVEKLYDFYKTQYPKVYATKLAQISTAVDRIKVLYTETAVPQMKVTPKTYANQMGHTDFPGCFRCHDGGHFLVENGVATKKVIPSTCDTCHTFPQIGPAVASLPLGEPPVTHSDKLWVFNHKTVATSLDPGGTTCGDCHARDYCVNCHSTGAVSVQHDIMTTNHAKVIRDQGNTACAYCHLPVFCARCHKEPVLPITTPFSQGSVDRTLGYMTINNARQTTAAAAAAAGTTGN